MNDTEEMGVKMSLGGIARSLPHSMAEWFCRSYGHDEVLQEPMGHLKLMSDACEAKTDVRWTYYGSSSIRLGPFHVFTCLSIHPGIGGFGIAVIGMARFSSIVGADADGDSELRIGFTTFWTPKSVISSSE